MPPVLPERFFRSSTSSSNFNRARADAPPSAFHPSTSPRRYACANGIVFDISSSATSGKLPLHNLRTNTASGTHGSVDAHPPGIMCGGSACCAAPLVLVLELVLALVFVLDPFVVVPAPGSVAGFSL